jgi:hypothetical protein
MSTVNPAENFADRKAHAAALVDTLKSLPTSLVAESLAAVIDQMLAEATTWRDLAVLLTAGQLADMEDLDRRKPGRDPARHDDIMLRTAKISAEALYARGHFTPAARAARA